VFGSFRSCALIAGIPLIFLFSARPARGCFSAQPNRDLPLASAAVQQDRLAELRSRFDKESDPVRKSKLMVQLGAAEFDDMEKRLGASDSSGALEELRSYQDQANSCEKALDARGVDPEKHPAGYKELQVSVREALRRLNNFMINMTGDEQQPFREIRKNLDNLDQDLIKELFPKKPGSGPGSGKSNN
jgi:hypothetical protein